MAIREPVSPVRPGSVAAWLVAIRPKTLPAAVAPVLVGAAMSHRIGGLDLLPILVAMVGALLLQIASNLANDLFDFEQGKDTEHRLGPVRAVQSGLLTPAATRVGLAVVIVGCLAVGGYLAARGGWPILAIGVASIVSALAYTAGPFPLGYHGLGDLFVFVFFGPVAVVGTQFAVTGTTSVEAYWASIPLGALCTNILVVNNLRDRAEDTITGKRTLAVRFGEGFVLGQARTLLVLAYASPLYFVFQSGHYYPLLLPCLTLPHAVRWVRTLAAVRGRALNEQLAAAAKLLLAFAVLFALGLWISR